MLTGLLLLLLSCQALRKSTNECNMRTSDSFKAFLFVLALIFCSHERQSVSLKKGWRLLHMQEATAAPGNSSQQS